MNFERATNGRNKLFINDEARRSYESREKSIHEQLTRVMNDFSHTIAASNLPPEHKNTLLADLHKLHEAYLAGSDWTAYPKSFVEITDDQRYRRKLDAAWGEDNH